MKNKYIAIIILLFVFSIFVRFYRLDLNSPAIYSDEAAHFFSLMTISQVGHNLNGFLSLPLLLSQTFTWIFGLNPFGVRSASAFWGCLVILIGYVFATRINRQLKLKSSLIPVVFLVTLVVSPWAFMISRIGHSQIPQMIFFVLLHLVLLVEARKVRQYVYSLIPLLLTAYLYPSMLIVAPLASIIPLLKIHHLLSERQKKLSYSIVFLAILMIIVVAWKRFYIFDPNARGNSLIMSNDINVTSDTNLYRGLARLSNPSAFSFFLKPESLMNKLFFNRPIAIISKTTSQYLNFFSPNWLFLKGDPVLRHSTNMVGELLLVFLPFFVFGLYGFFKNENNNLRQIFALWILISPIPAAITNDGGGYLLRSVTLLPFLTFLCAYGVIYAFNRFKFLKNKLACLIVIIGIIANATYFYFGYFHVYPSLSAKSFEYGFKELSDFQIQENNAPILVIWDGYYHNTDFRFWQKTNFSLASFNTKQINIGGSMVWQTYFNLYFSLPKDEASLSQMLANLPVEYVIIPSQAKINNPSGFWLEDVKPIKTILYPNGDWAFMIFKADEFK